MTNPLRILLTEMIAANLSHAEKLSKLRDAGVKMQMEGGAQSIQEMIDRELHAAATLQETLGRMQN